MIDEDLLLKGLNHSLNFNVNCSFDNSLQGTAVLKIINNKAKKDNFDNINNYNDYNNFDLSISKTNRIYIFKKFLENFNNLNQIKLKNFIIKLEKKI